MSYYKYEISKQVKIIILRKPASKCNLSITNYNKSFTFIMIYKLIMYSKKRVCFVCNDCIGCIDNVHMISTTR